MAEENRVYVLDCCTSGSDSSTAARLLSELTGSLVESSAEHVKWTISNRYYEAQVSLEVKGDLDKEKGAWQSVITLCNLNQLSSVKKAYSVWEGLPSEATPPVSLLVGVVEGCCLREGVRSEVVKWCLEKGVEFVVWELNPPRDNEGEEEEDFPESVGVARVSEALQAHMWPDMRLKERGRRGEDEDDGGVCNGEGGGGGEFVSSSCNERTSRSTDATSTSAVNGEDSKTKETGPGRTDPKDNEKSCSSSTPAGSSLPAGGDSGTSSEARLNDLLGASDMGDGGGEKVVEDFESLFAKFADMKAHAQSLPHEERKSYAEKVVMSFWKAVGGDEEEICSDNDSEQ